MKEDYDNQSGVLKERVLLSADIMNRAGAQKGEGKMKALWKQSVLLVLTLAVFLFAGAGIRASAEDGENHETGEQTVGLGQPAENGKKEEQAEDAEKTLEELEREAREAREKERQEEEEEKRLEAEGEPLSDYQQMQINLILSKMDELLQTDEQNTWYYCIMDLDHNGRMEFVAATQHPADRSTSLKVWEVNADTTGLKECVIEKEADESFPDLITDAADTYHDYNIDRWYYLFYDNVVLSPAELYTVRCSVTMREGVIGYKAYAIEHSELIDAYRYVSHMDPDGNPISADQYNAAGAIDFNEAERTTTHFDWFTAAEAKTAYRLESSFKVFADMKPAPVKPPINPPAVMQHDELAPVWGNAGETDAVYMVITKNPTSEKKKVDESLSFVTSANVYDSCYWTFVDPNGNEFDLDYFAAHHVNSYIDGYYEPTLTIRNLDEYMDGWGAYCTYSFKGQTAVTSTAWITIKK